MPLERIRAVLDARDLHTGSHADIDRSYGMLAAHVAYGALAVGGPLRERYLVGRRETTATADWRTEIGWPATGWVRRAALQLISLDETTLGAPAGEGQRSSGI